MRKLLCLSGFSAVFVPVMAPSSTAQWPGSPAQPERSLPLKIATNPSSSAGEAARPDVSGGVAPASNATATSSHRLVGESRGEGRAPTGRPLRK